MRAASVRSGRPRAAADIADLVAEVAWAAEAHAAAAQVAEIAIDWSELPALTCTRRLLAGLTEPGQMAAA